ncbi:MAG TPA: Rieske 2Fe-2S domain-containing protein [Acidimicrobiales bacterium]|nr:Rieske 2Fe-2S domain-containing protein [Acidimicrobiales bacterium]
MSDTSRGERRTERSIAIALGVSAVTALGLAFVFAQGGQPQAEGALLGVSLGSLGYALAAWGKYLLPPGPFVQERHPLGEEDEGDVEPVSRLVRPGEVDEPGPSGVPVVPPAEDDRDGMGRRPFLVKCLVGTMGALGLAALFPIRSLGPDPGRTLFETAWRKGSLVVNEEGRPVRATELEVGGVLTVFPEGHVGDADAQTLLIRAVEDDLVTRRGREDWAPQGHVAYSKVCTHAGCPVGLYQVATRQLLCPCHQSLFDVIDGARPVFGPATRSLPQLALEIDEDGFLRAQGDYDEAIGPAFWERP